MDSDNIKFFVPKVNNRLLIKKRRLWKYRDVERISKKGFVPFINSEAFKNRLHYMFGDNESVANDNINEKDKERIILLADQALKHEFDLLGSGPTKIEPIDWHSDFIRKVRWDKQFYCEISYIKGADIKVPWELSRCQHLLWLGEAYLITGNNKYAKEVVDEIEWWINDNPLMYSVNWTCSMEVAFRAVNWLYALNFISDYEGFNDSFVTIVSQSLWQHAFFIINNLEKSIPYSNNHYTSDLVGLIYVGSLFQHLRHGSKWKIFALKEFFKEVREQILPSGVHYEKSISYHRLMTEMLSYPIYMLRRLDDSVPYDVVERIKRMYAYIKNYTKPNGLSPLVADNDDGRFLPFLKRDFREHGYLNDHLSVETIFVTNCEKTLFIADSENRRIYKDAGIAILRQGNDYLFVNNGGYSGKPNKNKQNISSHTHNDLLSFDYCIGENDLIVDAGAYTYTLSEIQRNEFRSTKKHNTIVVDNEEQNGFVDSFQLKKNIEYKEIISPSENVVEGSYKTIDGQMKHFRRFELGERNLTITDVVEKKGNNHIAKIYFHFAEGLVPRIENNNIFLFSELKISFSVNPCNIVVFNDTLSPSYGKLISSKTAMIEFIFNDKIQIQSFFEKIQ